MHIPCEINSMNLDTELFNQFPKFPTVPFQSIHLFPSIPRQPDLSFLTLQVGWHFLEFYVNRVIQQVPFGIWVLLTQENNTGDGSMFCVSAVCSTLQLSKIRCMDITLKDPFTCQIFKLFPVWEILPCGYFCTRLCVNMCFFFLLNKYQEWNGWAIESRYMFNYKRVFQSNCIFILLSSI